jgi:hypothetical protein
MAFFPNQLPNLVVWLDGGDSSSFLLTPTSKITQWNDKSGCNNHAFQTNSIYYPRYQSNIGAIFENTKNEFLIISNSDLRPTNIYSVINPTSLGSGVGTSNRVILKKGNNEPNFQEFSHFTSLSNLVAGRRRVTPSGSITVTASNLATVQRFLFENTWNQSTVILYKDGFEVANEAFIGAQNVGTTQTRVGADFGSDSKTDSNLVDTSDPTNGWDGEINEILVYNTPLSVTNRERVEGYLAWKWNLQASLSETHPFRFYPPGTILPSSFTEIIQANAANHPGSLLFPSTINLENRLLAIKKVNDSFSSVTVYPNSLTNTLQNSTVQYNYTNPFDTNYFVAHSNTWYTLEGNVQNSLTTSSITANEIYTDLAILPEARTSSIQLGNTPVYFSSQFLFTGSRIVLGTNQASGFLNLSLQTLFQPNQVPGLTAWYDVADSNTLDVTGNLVNQWLDKSGNNRFASQSVDSNKPLLLEGQGISFTGTERLEVQNGGNIARNINYLSAFFVFNVFSNTTNQALYFITTSNTNDQRINWRSANITTNSVGMRGRRLDTNTLSNVQYNTATPVDSNLIFNGVTRFADDGRGDLFVNGSSVASNILFATSGSTNNTDSQNVTIGNNPVGTNPCIGVIKEILIYRQSNVSDSSRQQIEGYLAWKWGLVGSLPSDHPYKNIRP